MTMLSEIWSDLRYRVRALVHRDALEHELDEELRFHREREAERHERAGMPHDAALRRARAEFGRLDRVKEASRRARGTMALESVLHDLRIAARRLRRAPGFAAAAVLVLALGIGATTAAFGVVDAVLLKPLPYPQSHRLVRLTHTATLAGRSTVDQSDATVLLYQGHAQAFDGIAAWWSDNVDANIELSRPAKRRRAPTSRASRPTCSTCCACARRWAGASGPAKTAPAPSAWSWCRTGSGGGATTATPASSAGRSW